MNGKIKEKRKSSNLVRAPELMLAEIIKVDLNGAKIRVTYRSGTENIALQGEGDGLSWLPTRGLKPVEVKEEMGSFVVTFHIQLMGQESCEFRARAWDDQGTQYWEAQDRHKLVYDENKRVLLDGEHIRWGSVEEKEADNDQEKPPLENREERKHDVINVLSQKLREKEKLLEKQKNFKNESGGKTETEQTHQLLKEFMGEWIYSQEPPLSEKHDDATLKLLYWLFMTFLSDKGNFEFDSEAVKKVVITLHERLPSVGSPQLYDVVIKFSPYLYEILYLAFVLESIGEDEAKHRLQNLLPNIEALFEEFKNLRVIDVQVKTGEMRKNREFQYRHYLFKYF